MNRSAEESVKRFKRSNGLDTALYKHIPLPLFQARIGQEVPPLVPGRGDEASHWLHGADTLQQQDVPHRRRRLGPVAHVYLRTEQRRDKDLRRVLQVGHHEYYK